MIESGQPESMINSESAWTRQFMQGLADGPVPFHYPAAELAEDLLGASC